ncbi:MAG: sensor histidine kinase, partial [Tannerella sp.]|nr:sensor histidine kinase [Tannerella sp.]
ETEKKELRISALEEEKRLQRFIGLAVGAALLLAALALLFVWLWTRQKRRKAELEASQARLIAEQATLQIKQLEQEKQLVATQAVLDGETQERTRLARDLHDGLGSYLSAVKRNLGDIKPDGETAARIDAISAMLDDSIRELRRVAHHLMPDTLSRFGLKPALRDFCDALPSVQFTWYGEETRLDPKLEIMLYRTIHELLNNALKHSHAEHILVQVVQQPDRLAFTVQDDGIGFDPALVASNATASAADASANASADTSSNAATPIKSGMGLANVRTRLAAYGGTLTLVSHPNQGAEITGELQL